MLSALYITLTIIATSPATDGGDKKLLQPKDIAGKDRVKITLAEYHWDPEGNLKKGRKPDDDRTFRLPQSSTEGIVYGKEVSRNEFKCDCGVFPSPSNPNRIAVYRKDERAVGTVPALNVRYPMNGTASEKLSLCVCDSCGNVISTADVKDFDDERYLTQVCWSPDSRYIFIQVLDRAQHNMRLNMYCAETGSYIRTVLEEHNDRWIEPLDPLYFIKGSYSFIYRTDNRDGYRNLYLCDTLGNCKRISPLDEDVDYISNDGKYLYYLAHCDNAANTALYRTKLKGRKAGAPEKLTQTPGTHRIAMDEHCTSYLDRWTSLNTPGVLELRKADGSLIKELDRASDPLENFAKCEVELGTVKSADGKYDNLYRLIKPAGFDPSKKYPLILYVYGGPHSQLVSNSYLGQIRMWEMLMAQRGYVVYVQDNRGTMNRGAEYEKAINRQCGVAEMQDQIAGLDELMKQPWIDCDRIGVHGWSYGGFMTISLLTNYPHIFKTGLAGGPVIDWRWYEVMYGERYMDTEATNREGFEKTSLINRTGDLKAKLLICHGLKDVTVIPQQSLNFVQKCIKEGRQLEYFPYPESQHNMVDEAAVHLYTKITSFFENNL